MESSQHRYRSQLETTSWFRGLPVELRDYLISHANLLTLEKGQFLYRRGEQSDGLYAVLGGALAIGTVGADGKEALLAVLGPTAWIAACTDASRIIEAALATAALRPAVKSFFDEATNTVSYVVRDPATQTCAVIDSVLDFDAPSGRTSMRSVDVLINYIKSESLSVRWLLETHAHADHLSAAPYLHERLGGQMAIGHEILRVQQVFGKIFNAGSDFARDGSQFDHLFGDGERFQIGALQAMALHVPGHTPACLAYVIGDAVFPGDTLFMPDYARLAVIFRAGTRINSIAQSAG
jgi:glyoxylase-like metal-dependent hydrolase (beta-lactamase superfamily II)